MSLLDTASLIVTPNGYKEGKLYSVIPSDGSGDMSVVRATTATRVNSAGLVELVPYNLLSYSQEFDNAYWQNSNSTITPNNTNAPDGTMTADRLNLTAGYGSSYIYPFTTNGNIVTYSCYFKKGTANTFYIESNPPSGTIGASFNLDTEVITTFGVTISSNIENLGNDWYRCSVTGIPNGLSYIAFGIYQNTTGLTGYLWGAQLNEGTIKPYQKTETRLNIPRLDYSNGTCPSLLVEPQRTNLLKYSEQFDDSSWVKISSTVLANQIISPNGINNADKLTATGTSIPCVYQGSNLTGTYTISAYVKKGTSNYCWLYLHSNSAIFNLDNGTIVSGSNATITSAGDGWYRVTLTGTLSTYDIDCIGVSDGTTINGITGQYIYIWGAQLEAGSYPTSYIPTTSASVTRNADVVSKTGINSLIGQTEGTVFVELTCDFKNPNGAIPFFIRGGGASYNESTYIQFGGNNFSYNIFSNYNLQAVLSSGTLTEGQNVKVGFAYNTNDFVLYVNGVQTDADTSGVPSLSMDGIDIGTYLGAPDAFRYDGSVKATALWKTRLTNTQLAQLTTI